ncbi:murein hydrolase activator EnvC family protein [Pseudoflavonifractor sp. HCP28S3_F10]|uniref:murein hydrolase activator EnvC family protein n=1 Tax=Pseudoflavonifractor sp. HCP28S3_F10 TaxID=3438947 RepID=UPI003F88E8C1
MANRHTSNRGNKKQKADLRRILTTIMAVLLAALMLLPMLTMAIGGAGAVTQSEIDKLKQQQQASKNRQQELKDELAGLKEDQAAAQQKRNLLQQQLNAIADEIDNIDAQISYYDGQIAQKEAERVEAVAREEEQYELFCQRVRAMEEDGDVTYWSVLFASESFSDLLSRIADIDQVMEYDNAVMDQLVETRRQIEAIKAELEQSKADQEAIRAEKEAVRAEQEKKVAEAKKLLDEINASAEKVNEALDAENAAIAKLNADIAKKQKEMEEERKKNNVVLDTGSGYTWPLPGYYKLTSAFGYRIHPITGRPHSHTGIDIPAPYGTSVKAARGGQVITSGRHSSYGEYVVIDHGNGNSTLYAHMSSRSVSVGQIVKQGQEVGKVGSTGSSTGNHLHLEIRVNYTRVDPEKYYPNLPFVRAYNW